MTIHDLAELIEALKASGHGGAVPTVVAVASGCRKSAN